jgi:hypothetical protein
MLLLLLCLLAQAAPPPPPPTPTYTNRDGGSLGLRQFRPPVVRVPESELAWLRQHQYVAMPPDADGPRSYTIPAGPDGPIPQPLPPFPSHEYHIFPFTPLYPISPYPLVPISDHVRRIK